ncbi:Ig-like domain repeat protein [Telmatobacter sp. DSM 110680]|uniref:Ig-like domain repeat protein n=1 Tax=Telmatobacter sp. DSM 110680 TaxID=3036704 RepID=A0AAU7DK70_9BACT
MRLPGFFFTSVASVTHFKSNRSSNRPCGFLLAILLSVTLSGNAAGQAQGAQPKNVAGRDLIARPIEDGQRTVLRGNRHPLARAEFDRGMAPAGLPMTRMLLVLKRSDEQESTLKTLLADQQAKGSAHYHQWLTPEEFGRQFGPTDNDIEKVTAWLNAHGFQVAGVSKGRTAIEFSGTAGQVQEAFRTAIHSYVVKGEQRWANAEDPSIPTEMTPVVKGVLTLHNFPRHSNAVIHGQPVKPMNGAASPYFTFTSGQQTFYGLGPTDFATIYDVLPLWKAGIDGSGQTIAIVGETNINLNDVNSFRSLFGLPANPPKIILNGSDPGIVGDEPEALLDVSWSGAVAKNATIDLVVSASTETSLGVDLSALYIVDNDIAPVMSESYGECEATLGNAGNAFYNSLWQQAAAEGITVMVSAGDSGSAVCDDFNSSSFASQGLAVSGFASTPYNVAVGGTDFDQSAANAATYWNATNDPTTASSAKSYIPETTWNQSCAAQGLDGCGPGATNLNIVAGSGGPSNCASADSNSKCIGGYAKPSWQTGNGVPQDGVRDLPDVSLFASAGSNGSFYIICEADFTPFGPIPGFNIPCNLTNLSFVGLGGTSGSSPAFAGMMALVNQKMAMQGLSARQGNANYVLYSLAAQGGASCDSSKGTAGGSACIFHDVTKGNNAVPCAMNTPNCGQTNLGGFGVLVDPNNSANPAWTTTAGYDLATGLGTIDAFNLVNAWGSVAMTQTTTTLTNVSPASLTHGQAVNVSATVAAKSGSGIPTGRVTVIASPAGQNLSIDDFAIVNGVASGTTSLLPGGTYNVVAHYGGDGNFAASDSAPLQVTVTKENSQTKTSLAWYDFTNGVFTSTTTVPYGSIVFLRGDVTGTAGTSCAPNPKETEAACPTGSMNFTSGGKPVDAGTYALNSLGYAEDQRIALDLNAVGSYSLQAQYGGDASYNASQASLNAVVTQAPTYIYYLEIQGLSPTINANGETYVAYSGQKFDAIAVAYSQSILGAPTGTISILENGNAASGTLTSYQLNGSYTGGFAGVGLAYLEGDLTTSIDTPGSYNFTATYAGDGNYLGSQSPFPVNVTIVDTTFNISGTIANVNVKAGSTATTTVSFAGVDNFAGQIQVTCKLPTAMAEATCTATQAALGNTTTATSTVTITTTAAHKLAANHAQRVGGMAVALAGGILLFAFGGRRRGILLPLVLVMCAGTFVGCGGSGSSSGGGGSTDLGTVAGSYTVSVSATSMNITRTGTFTVTVQ